MKAKADPGLKVAKVHYNPQDVLFNEGDPPTGLYLIEDGIVEVFRQSGNRTIAVARLGRGEVVGELAAIEGVPHSRTARAVTGVSALKVAPDQFEAALADSPALIRMVLKRVVRKLHRTNAVAFGQSKGTT